MHLNFNFVYESIHFCVFQAHCLRETPIASFMRHVPSWPPREILLLFGFVFRMWPFWRARSLSPGCLRLPSTGMHFRTSIHIYWCWWDQQKQRGASSLPPGLRELQIGTRNYFLQERGFLGHWEGLTGSDKTPKLSNLLLINLLPNIPHA